MSDVIAKLSKNWARSGIQKGDTVLIHSAIKRTLINYQCSPNDILNSLLDAVGSSGTLVFPLFNFDFTSGVAFDIRTTPSHMGALTEAARCYKGAVRTGHPIYSFAVIGHHASQFQDIDNKSGYGADSPFAKLKELDGKIAVLDLPDQNSMTFYHHIEEMHDVDYRYLKDFTGDYTRHDGKTENRTYQIFVRDFENGVLTHVNPCGELLWDAKLYQGYRPKDNTGMRVINANQLYDFVSDIIQDNRAHGLLYKIEEGQK